jgi:hypothetical protein
VGYALVSRMDLGDLAEPPHFHIDWRVLIGVAVLLTWFSGVAG